MKAHDLVTLASIYWESASLNAAVKLGVFAPIAEEPQTAADLANELRASALHLEALLDALAGMGVLNKLEQVEEAAQYDLPMELRAVLDPRSPDSLLGAFALNADLFGLWGSLAQCVQNGEPALPNNPHLGDDPERLKHFVEGMHSRAGIMARGVLPHLAIPSESRILDVGAGPCTFAMKLCETDASLRVTVQDLPPILEAAKGIHAGRAELSQISFLPGSYHETTFPEGQDIVFYCGALHQEPIRDATPLIQRMVDALKPGGRLLIVDLFVDDSRTQPSYSALFHINTLLMRPTAHVHSLSSAEMLVRSCGCGDVSSRQLPDTPYALVSGTKA